jgi:pSer/pThr/pTyr-binding forkhead associated (FHA) protein
LPLLIAPRRSGHSLSVPFRLCFAFRVPFSVSRSAFRVELGYDRRVPLIRCPECGQAYNVPPAVAVRLPNSIANCHCGHWLCGSREGLLQRLGDEGRIEEIDVQPYKVALDAAPARETIDQDDAVGRPRSVHIVARTRSASINTTYTIAEHPLWIGRRGCHLDFDDPELSIQHCCIYVRGGRLIIRDADSYTGTFLDGQQINEAYLDDGVHLLRVGGALLSVEPTETAGVPVEPLTIAEDELRAPPVSLRARKASAAHEESSKRLVLNCLEGVHAGQRFAIPDGGATVGREGTIRIHDDYISRKHFQLTFDEAGVLRVQDLGSRNGTYLNTLPAKNTKVRPGDEIRAGFNLFRVEEE